MQITMDDVNYLKVLCSLIADRIEEVTNYNPHITVDKLAYAITEGENANDSWYCNTASAVEDIKKYFDLYRNFSQVYIYENPYDIVDATEQWHCFVMIRLCNFLYESLFAALGIDDNTWDEKFNIDTIKDYVNKLSYYTLANWFISL